jgi:hypothetical protein
MSNSAPGLQVGMLDSISFLLLLLCFLIAFFLKRSKGIAADIGSLAPGLDRLVLELGIGTQGLRKAGRTTRYHFQAHLPFV